MVKVEYSLKRCCGALLNDIKSGYLRIIHSGEGEDSNLGIGYGSSKVDYPWLTNCPHCGESINFVPVIVEDERRDPEDLKIQIRRGMTPFEKTRFEELLEYKASQMGTDKSVNLLNILEEVGGDRAKWMFWRQFAHQFFELEEYSCVGRCDNLTQHIIYEDHAYCTVCGTSQERDSSGDGIVSIINLWNKKKEVVGIMKIEEFDYMNSKAYRTILEVQGVRFEIGEPESDRNEAKRKAEDMITVE